MDDTHENAGEEDFFEFEIEDTVGTDVEIYHFLTEAWKKVKVLEVDVVEGEMLVGFDDGYQEWTAIDKTKIRLLKDSLPYSMDNRNEPPEEGYNSKLSSDAPYEFEHSVSSVPDIEFKADIKNEEFGSGKEDTEVINWNPIVRIHDFKKMHFDSRLKCLKNSILKAENNVDTDFVVHGDTNVSSKSKRRNSFKQKKPRNRNRVALEMCKIKNSSSTHNSKSWSDIYEPKIHLKKLPKIMSSASSNNFLNDSNINPELTKLETDDDDILSSNRMNSNIQSSSSVSEKLPSLKIKLTRSKLWDGTSSSPRDTFVVTGQTIDGISQPVNRNLSSNCGSKSRKRNRRQSTESEDCESESNENFRIKKKTKFDSDLNQDFYTPKIPKFQKPYTSSFDKTDDANVSWNSTIGEPISDDILNLDSSYYNEKKKIKILLPKPRVPTPNITPILPVRPNETGSSVTPCSVSSETSGFICPKKDCKKQFRSENLLMMHIKHYHTEYKTMLSRTPNVADLAYARTTGKTIETSSRQSDFLQKISRIEESRTKELEKQMGITNSDVDENINNSTSITWNDIHNTTGEFKKLGRPFESSSNTSTISPLLAQLQKPPLHEPSGSILSQSNSILSSLLRMDTTTSSCYKRPKPAMPWALLHAEKSSHRKSHPGSSNTDAALKLQIEKKKKKSLSLASREIVNCVCGYIDEDGLMIQCEICLCWQHANCNNIEHENDVPSDYVCVICRNPRRQRSSKKYAYTGRWFSEGKLPCFDSCKTDMGLLEKRQKYLKDSHVLLGRLIDLKNILHTLKVKNYILGQTSDHPKLYLWSKPWNEKKLEEEKRNLDSKKSQCEGPVPEAAINMKVCRKNLLEHLEEEMVLLEERLVEIENKIDDLDYDEVEYDDNSNASDNSRDECESEEEANYTKELFHLISADLNSVGS